MRRFILTGAPGAGKTTTARLLAATGATVIPEAATDLIETAQTAGDDAPWERAAFCDRIAALQSERQQAADSLPGPVQFFDRSPVCTLAMARFLGHPIGPGLAAELDRLHTEHVYETTVFLHDLLGFITATPVRRIDLDDARRFEALHVQAYTEHGYTIVRIPAADPDTRARHVHDLVKDTTHD